MPGVYWLADPGQGGKSQGQILPRAVTWDGDGPWGDGLQQGFRGGRLPPQPMRKKLTPSQLRLRGFLSPFLSPNLLGLLQHCTHTKASETALGRSRGTFFSPLKQAKICGHGGPASRATLKHQGSQAAMTFQGCILASPARR